MSRVHCPRCGHRVGFAALACRRCGKLFPGAGLALAACIALLVLGGAAIGMAVARQVFPGSLGHPRTVAISAGVVCLIWFALFTGTGVRSRTVRCPECGGYAASSAGACPACGRFLPGHFVFKGIVLAACAVVLYAGLVLASGVLVRVGGLLGRIAEHDARLGHRLAVQEEARQADAARDAEDPAEEHQSSPAESAASEAEAD